MASRFSHSAMAIFHSYVKLPEGNAGASSRWVWKDATPIPMDSTCIFPIQIDGHNFTGSSPFSDKLNCLTYHILYIHIYIYTHTMHHFRKYYIPISPLLSSNSSVWSAAMNQTMHLNRVSWNDPLHVPWISKIPSGKRSHSYVNMVYL